MQHEQQMAVFEDCPLTARLIAEAIAKLIRNLPLDG
jgi:hypothetical protein